MPVIEVLRKLTSLAAPATVLVLVVLKVGDGLLQSWFPA
jgi:hypothetical protein